MTKYQCHKVWKRLAIAVTSYIVLATLNTETILAATLSYDLVDVSFDADSGTATGFFAIEDSPGSVLLGKIETTPNPNNPAFAGATYTNLNSDIGSSLFYLFSDEQGPTPFFYRLFLTVNSAALGSARIETPDFT